MLSFTAVALGGIAYLAYAVHVAAGVGGRPVAIILLTVVHAAAAVTCGVIARGSSTANVAWGMLGAAIVAYGGTSVYYTVVPDAADRFPAVFDGGWFVFYPLAFVALVAFVRRRVVASAQTLWIDSAIGALVVAALGAAFMVPQLGGARDLTVVGQLLFFLGDLGFLGFLVAACAASGWRDGASLFLLAFGSVVLAIGHGLWVLEVAHGATAPGIVPSLAWPLGMLLLAAGTAQKPRGAPPASSPRAKIGIPVASAAGCVPIVFLSPAGSVHNSLASVALGLIVARLAISLLENVRLLDTIRRSAITDPLTGLANRQLLLDRLEARDRRHGVLVVFDGDRLGDLDLESL